MKTRGVGGGARPGEGYFFLMKALGGNLTPPALVFVIIQNENRVKHILSFFLQVLNFVLREFIYVFQKTKPVGVRLPHGFHQEEETFSRLRKPKIE
jgi:hypothetical protein